MSKQEDIKPIENDDEEELQTARQEIFSYYRHLRSNLFSVEYETKLTKEVFDLKLLQLSQDKKQSEFENFILATASRLNIGTPWNPYIIDLSEIRTGISTIAADDDENDSDWWTLQGFKIGRKPTQSGVYIHHGKKVVIKQAK